MVLDKLGLVNLIAYDGKVSSSDLVKGIIALPILFTMWHSWMFDQKCVIFSLVYEVAWENYLKNKTTLGFV